eukprot:CAMPEP_0177776678 /NCGR_PEP_ID=MMETSP0491_2-20121128/14849_1 /TAXON_ID=63592 /ORGANISM="Tetraselmis chuii, Strain PLY429" /LENGTH=94 /DNA_ID=CAMNT_0019295501 /DNA_START=129 /DNA_END=413 /DNA_ORIENTATION=-
MVWKGFEFGPAPDYPGGPKGRSEDPVGYFQWKEHDVREKYVKMAQAKILRQKLKECYWKEEVNHMKNCKELAQQYLQSIQGIGVHRVNQGQFDK